MDLQKASCGPLEIHWNLEVLSTLCLCPSGSRAFQLQQKGPFLLRFQCQHHHALGDGTFGHWLIETCFAGPKNHRPSTAPSQNLNIQNEKLSTSQLRSCWEANEFCTQVRGSVCPWPISGSATFPHKPQCCWTVDRTRKAAGQFNSHYTRS